MTLRKKIIAGIVALAVVMTFAISTRARADDDDWHHRDRHEWGWHHDRDDDNHHAGRWYRDRDDDSYAHPGYGSYQRYRRGYLPPNGEGMINRRNPNFYWACDSQGHHCHWAPRY